MQLTGIPSFDKNFMLRLQIPALFEFHTLFTIPCFRKRGTEETRMDLDLQEKLRARRQRRRQQMKQKIQEQVRSHLFKNVRKILLIFEPPCVKLTQGGQKRIWPFTGNFRIYHNPSYLCCVNPTNNSQ